MAEKIKEEISGGTVEEDGRLGALVYKHMAMPDYGDLRSKVKTTTYCDNFLWPFEYEVSEELEPGKKKDGTVKERDKSIRYEVTIKFPFSCLEAEGKVKLYVYVPITETIITAEALNSYIAAAIGRTIMEETILRQTNRCER